MVMRAFEDANSETITRLHRDGQFPGIAWIQFIPDTAERRAPGAVMWGFPSTCLGMRADVATQPGSTGQPGRVRPSREPRPPQRPHPLHPPCHPRRAAQLRAEVVRQWVR
jgi:hypothetical protein